jgi:anthranilate/para-aminobenzoate synthase component I
LNIAIRTAICAAGKIHFNVGAGIVADSIPEMEYEETLAKARGFFAALKLEPPGLVSQPARPGRRVVRL